MAKIENFLWPLSGQQGQDSGEKSFFNFNLFGLRGMQNPEPTHKFATKQGTFA